MMWEVGVLLLGLSGVIWTITNALVMKASIDIAKTEATMEDVIRAISEESLN